LATNANYRLSGARYDGQVQTNIAKIREAKGLSQVELAERLGIHVTNLNKIERGKSSPDLVRLQQIAKELRVSVADLVSDGEPAKGRQVRVRGYVQAGHWAESWEFPEEEQYEVPVPDDEYLAPYKLYAAETRGPSMNKRYPEGTIVVFTDAIETHEEIQIGKRYVVERQRADGLREATVKTLWRDESGKFWLVPESDDPRYQESIPVEGAEEDTVRIIGRVRYAVTRE
jgi:transcriptional regulator with XRE-family HTH domain